MASKSLISWGVGLLLAATLGCNSGTATQSCPVNTTFCGASCTDTRVDPGNCGMCGKACTGTDNLCQQGACVSSCSGGQTKCGNSCVDTKTDKNNCNSCGNACSGTQTCNNGACVNNSTTGVGGATGQGGGNNQSGGSGQGGANTSVGGASTGGAVQQGGSNQGGAATGGAQNQGGSNQGGAATGGAQNRGGNSSGGAATGGASTTNAGGATNAGGTTSAGGTTTSAGGTTSTGSVPAGWWTSWKTEGWKGCAWTGIDTVTVAPTKTTITPTDFAAVASGGPYAVSGSVGPNADYGGVALLGFNLNQDPAGASCAYNPAAATQDGPPGVTFASTATGIAVNFSKTGSDTTFTLRIQIQGPKGATDATQRWCQTITAANGKAFLPFNKFYTACWFDGVSGKDPGTLYPASSPISAVVFTVPGGATAAVPYAFTVNGFALGTSAADAPDGGVVTQLKGTIGGPNGTDDDFKRVKVSAGGHDYVIQNNNWGDTSGSQSQQVLTYVDNSFTVTTSTGSVTGQGVPAAFPSIYIGASGNTANGLFSTHPGDNLPKQVSALTTIPTTFTYNRCTTSQGYNAAYDVWFANAVPSGQYNDAISGFVMVWLCDPDGFQPIGSDKGTVTIDNKSWHMWQGTRGGSGANSNAPVISYVASSSMLTYSFDLNLFIKHAVAQTQFASIQNSWYLTDVFGGFEIWNGPAAQGLQLQTFTCVVN